MINVSGVLRTMIDVCRARLVEDSHRGDAHDRHDRADDQRPDGREEREIEGLPEGPKRRY
jgi:hypothetical protein